MADSILRLKVESKEYDNKLKRASEGLTRYVDNCRKVGGTLEVVEKETLSYVKALGQMDTASRTATGKLSEMKKAFMDLSMQYKQMTEAERKSPVGKALSASLDQMKGRIQEYKGQMDEVANSLSNVQKNSGGLFGGSKMDGMLQVLGGNLMTKGAMMLGNLVTDMGECITQGIELARQGEGIRIAFERLNRPDLLDNLRKATHGTVTDLELMKQAVKFNDFKLNIDEMGTLLAFAQQKAKDTGQSVDYMVDSIVTGLGRQSLMILDNLGLSASEIKDRMKETGDMTSAVAAIIRDQMTKAGDYIETAADRATKADVELKNAMEELGRTFQPLAESGESMWTSLKVGALDLLNSAIKPLIDAYTQLGLLRAQEERLGGTSKVGQMVNNLRGTDASKRSSVYNQQQSKFWDYINPRENYLKELERWRKGQRTEQLQQSIAEGRERFGIDDRKIRAQIEGAKNMLRQYQKEAKEILNPTTPTKTAPDVTTTKTKPSPVLQELTAGSIDAQTAKVRELQKAWNAAASDDSRRRIKDEIEQAQLVLDVMTGKTSIKNVEVVVNDAESMQKLRNMEGVTLTSKTLTVTADTSDALVKLQEMEGILIRAQQLSALEIKTTGLSDGLIPSPFAADNRQSEIYGSLKLQLDKDSMEALGQHLIESLNEGKDDKMLEKTMGDVSKGLGGINNIVGGLTKVGIEIPTEIQSLIGVIEGAMAIIQGVQTIISLTQTPALVANTAALGILTAAVSANTAASFIPFAGGGVVHAADGYVSGTTYSGDQIPAMLNAGEVVLNRAQAGNLAAQLQDSRPSGMGVSHVSGEQIYVALGAYLRRTGRGEIVTWK